MNKKTKIKVVFLNIITFGYFNHYLKKQINSNDQTLKNSNKIPFNLDDLINYLGGKNNIVRIESSLNTLQVFFNDKNKIDIEQIKSLGAKGTILAKDKISIVFGDYSIPLKDALIKELND